jgi:hypothetical protein
VREKDGRFFFHMYHPAAALHQQALRETLLADMRKFATFLQGPYRDAPRPEPAADEVADDDDRPEQLSLF